MIKVNICREEQVYNSSLSSWIKEQFHNRRRAGADLWFIIKIENNGIKVTLPSAGAPKGRGKPISQFNHRERQIIDLWIDMDLKQNNNVSNLLRFLNKVERAVK